MKKFTKLFLSCAAVTAVTAAVASSAMAANLAGVEYVEPAEGSQVASVKVTLPDTFTDQSKTLLILAKDTTLAEAAAAPSTETILQVQQYDGEVNGSEILVPISALTEGEDDGTYRVYMGGTSGTVYEGSFRLGGSDRLLGDVEEDGSIDALDGGKALKGVAGLITLEGDDLLAADADDDGHLNALDGGEILKNVAELKATLGTKTISDKLSSSVVID